MIMTRTQLRERERAEALMLEKEAQSGARADAVEALVGKSNDEEVVDVEEVKEDLAVVGKNDDEEVDVEEAENDLAVGFESDGSVELPGASLSEDLFGKENLGKVKKSRGK